MEKENLIPPDIILKQWTSQIIKAIHFMHERDIVHRDLTHTNVIVGDEGKIMVGDFGLSKMLSQSQSFLTSKLGSIEF